MYAELSSRNDQWSLTSRSFSFPSSPSSCAQRYCLHPQILPVRRHLRRLNRLQVYRRKPLQFKRFLLLQEACVSYTNIPDLYVEIELFCLSPPPISWRSFSLISCFSSCDRAPLTFRMRNCVTLETRSIAGMNA